MYRLQNEVARVEFCRQQKRYINDVVFYQYRVEYSHIAKNNYIDIFASHMKSNMNTEFDFKLFCY